MQVFELYKDILQENVQLLMDFLNSAQGSDISAVEKKYEKAKKKKRLS